MVILESNIEIYFIGEIIFCFIKFAALSPLYSIFSQTAAKYPNHNALWVNGDTYTYADLEKKSDTIKQFLASISGENIGLLASKSITAYSGILGILSSGKTYVPLNPKFPIARNAAIAKMAQTDCLIVGAECCNFIQELSELLQDSTVLFFPENVRDDISENVLNTHTCYFKGDTVNTENVNLSTSEFAYILFTSGSTGVPKGVPIYQQSVIDYVSYLNQRFEPTPNDRFSQTFDLTFDLSVHDLFLCWNAGGCLYSVPEKSVLGPGKFIKEHQLTFWFSVPSVLQFMDTFKMLKPDNFPSLRVSLFCGEPLPLDICVKWQKATSYQRCENIYGPTEATIGISHYTIPNDANQIKSRNGIVSIGSIFATQSYHIDPYEDNNGELLLGGSQLSPGYWHNEEKTSEAFFYDNAGFRWYRSGDIVSQDADGDLYYLGRKDFQIKIRGYRIELEEINHAIMKYTGETLVYCLPWPAANGVAEGIVAFITDKTTRPKTDILQYLQSILPEYMIPNDIMFVEHFPLNSNGKIDKLKLLETLNNQ